MDRFEELIIELKEKLKEARSGDQPSLFTEKVDYVYNLVKSYRKRLERIEENLKQYLDEKGKVVTQKKEEMLKGFVQSISISRTDILTLIDQGWNYIASGKYSAAERVLEKALEKAPNNIKVMKLLGWAYMYTERFDDALLLYQKVLNIEPGDEMARNNLGYICYKKKIFGEAIEHLSKVIKMGKDVSAVLYAHYYLGLVYFERNMYNDAIHFFEKALEIGPNLYEAKYYMGLSFLGKGNEQKAKVIWKGMVDENPNNRWAKLAHEKLEEKKVSRKRNEREKNEVEEE
jgi:tetratricopeptide (TPR) repeat protein